MDMGKFFGQFGPRMVWTEGDGGGGTRRGGDEPKMSRKHIYALIFFVILFVCAMSFSSIVDFYTDLLWYESLGFDAVLWRRFSLQLVCFAVSAVVTFIFLCANWYAAARFGTSELRRATDEELPISVTRCALAAAAAFALLFGWSDSGSWEKLFMFINAADFGTADQIFGIDVGFYIFVLPFVLVIQDMAFTLIVFASIGTVLIYLLCRSLRSEDGHITIIRPARAHFALLAAVFAVQISAGFVLDRYDLLYSPTGIVFGVGYTDLYITLPSLTAMAVASLAVAAAALANVKFKALKPAIALAVLTAAAGFVTLTFVPGIVQSYVVQPNEYEREKEFIERHIEATRRAWSIDDVVASQVMPTPAVTADEMRENALAVSNIRLWDYGPLLRTYKQLQEIRTYYDFNDIDIDRYMIDGRPRQVMLAVRELDLSALQNRTWVNSHLEFTHGYGVVMNPVNELEGSGMPVFFMKDLPPRSTVPIDLDRPEIYYGEKTDDYALVMTNVREFDYPTGDSNSRSVYAGRGGVGIGTLARRLLFAVRFRDSEILFTDALRPESRVLFNRNIRAALRELAPFLIFDDDAYPVIIDGRIKWIQDAYTATDMYPYSLPLSANIASNAGIAAYSRINYIRNSVKIVIDAYDGDIQFFITDDDDPLITCWQRIFPELFADPSALSPELASHFRYPEELFEAQREIFSIYHMTDTNTFYNREDVWVARSEGRSFQPNYVTMTLMGEREPEFVLISPFTPLGRNNLIGWIAARCDGENYGELVAYQFPKQELVYGPAQIEALIDQNTEISSQLSLWSQHGSDVIRGSLIVVPIGKSLLYVEPLYLRAERSDLPELKRIILSTGGRLAWGADFEEAAIKLFGASQEAGKKPRPSTPPAQDQPTPPRETDARSLASQARVEFEAAQSASRRGDWASYGEHIARLGELLEQLDAGE